MALKLMVHRLIFLKPLLNLTCISCLGFIVFLFLFSTIAMQNQYALPSLILAAWSMLFSALLGLLVNSPEENQGNKSWLANVRYKLAKGLFSLTVVLFVSMTLALLYVTVKLLGIWL